MAICDALDLKAPELLPHIKRLFDLEYVGKHICGDYDHMELDISKPEEDFVKKKFLSVLDRYEEITSTWYAYSKEEPVGDSLKEPIRHEHEPGRNDPCQCGSGKKYKKCCLNKAHS